MWWECFLCFTSAREAGAASALVSGLATSAAVASGAASVLALASGLATSAVLDSGAASVLALATLPANSGGGPLAALTADLISGFLLS